MIDDTSYYKEALEWYRKEYPALGGELKTLDSTTLSVILRKAQDFKDEDAELGARIRKEAIVKCQ